MNVPLDTSVTVASAASEIRTFRFVPIASGTVQAYVNGLASVEAVITTVCSSDAKAFVEYSSLTLMNEPVRVQVMFWFAPTIQVSPPLGKPTVTEPLIVKFALDSSMTVASPRSVILTFNCVPILSGTVHE